MTAPILLVDGYNIIGDWEELKLLKEEDFGSARDQLVSILSAYHPWCWERIIIVFDGQKFAWEKAEGVEVVFTDNHETADTLIERLAAGLTLRNPVEVATSDFAEYRAASNLGAYVMSAAALKERLAEKQQDYRERLNKHNDPKGIMLNEILHKKVVESLDKLKGY